MVNPSFMTQQLPLHARGFRLRSGGKRSAPTVEMK
jgi:hypothetical protein